MINKLYSSRVIIIQNIYSQSTNPEAKLDYKKSQFKKFIKDVTEGTLEREELINQTISEHLGSDIDFKKTDKILKIIVQAAVFELLFKHNNSIKVIIVEYLKAAEFFLEKSKVKYINAILDKISRILRKSL
tara:strand:+ start:324 stop:716 length:393 start_codon:yes stop_codon:yes gene_type:complete